MELGVTAWSFESLTLKDTLALCSGLGFSRVDIPAFRERGRNGFDPFEVGERPQQHADSLLRELAPYGMEVPDFFPQFGASLHESSLNDPDPAVRARNRETIRGIIRFCQLAGIPGISLSPGVHHEQVSFEQNLDTSAQEFAILAEMAVDSGVTIRVEPHMHAIADTPERTLYLLHRASGAKVTLDYAHFMLQYISMDRIHKLLPHTDHVHVRQARMGKMQTRTEEGEIDYADIAARLAVCGYPGVLSIEYVNMDWYDCNQVDCISETLKTKAALERALARSGN